MEQRTLGRTGRSVSVVGLGTWQLGADWGEVSETDALDVLAASVEGGVTFFDTADVYGDGRSEQLIGRFLAEHPDAGVTVATKMGRRVDQVPENYVLDNFRAWTERSRRNLGVDTLDLVQLHCPPTPRLHRRRALRRAGHPGRRGRDRGVRRERREGRGGARRHRPAARRQRADHRSTPSASSRSTRCFPAAAEAGRRDHRAGAARLRPALRASTTPSTTFAAGRPPHLQPRRQRVRRRRDVLGRRLRDRAARGAGVRARSCPTGVHAGAGRASRGCGSTRRSPA